MGKQITEGMVVDGRVWACGWVGGREGVRDAVMPILHSLYT